MIRLTRRDGIKAGIIALLFLQLMASGGSAALAQGTSRDSLIVLQRLRAILPQGSRVEPSRVPEGYKAAFRIAFPQPLDHFDRSRGKFWQRVYFAYRDSSAVTVISTPGYGASRLYISEPARMLQANQIVVEHRFFGTSRPDSLQWAYLTARQAAADHHRIVQAFRRFLKGKWVSTGRSKGGTTALLFKHFYPDDVDAVIAYVAPLGLAQEDPRIDAFIQKLSADSCAQKIEAFQMAVLRQRGAVKKFLEDIAREKNYSFSIGLEKVLEFAVLEYPFSFWQWHRVSCKDIPDSTADPRTLAQHLQRVIGLHTIYSDGAIRRLYPAFYQFCTELGYYGFLYNSRRVFEHLKVVPDPSNRFFAPPGVDLTFRPQMMMEAIHDLRHNGRNIIAIYGGLDPWSATGLVPSGKAEILVVIKPDGDHSVRIRDLSREDQEKIFRALQRWLGVQVAADF